MLLPLVRQFLFLLIDTLLTSNPAFARDLRRDSVPAPMMARTMYNGHTIPGGEGDAVDLGDHKD
jgi:hypothetical protein